MATSGAANVTTNAATWVPEVSKFWTAKADERCPAPCSDDYRDWSLVQLKREITQRQLKTDHKKRNKEAYVRILLADDEMEAAEDVTSVSGQSSNAGERGPVSGNSQQEVVDVCDEDEDEDDVGVVEVHGDHRQQQQQEKQPSQQQHQEKQSVKKRKVNSSSSSNVTPPSQRELESVRRIEYMHHKLSIQAARIDIETRKFELESKREARDQELHHVQLALAQEQLKQAKITTQKMKTEWMVDQILQKKRLRDAGISEEESSGLF